MEPAHLSERLAQRDINEENQLDQGNEALFLSYKHGALIPVATQHYVPKVKITSNQHCLRPRQGFKLSSCPYLNILEQRFFGGQHFLLPYKPPLFTL